MKKYRLHNYTTACPTQWQGYDQDGNSIFVRYRWGKLRVYESPPNKEHPELTGVVPKAEVILLEDFGKPGDGYMSDGDLQKILVRHGIECEFFDVGTVEIAPGDDGN